MLAGGSRFTIWAPIALLGVLAALSGFVVFDGVGDALGFGGGFLEMVENVFGEAHAFEIDWLVLLLSTALVGAALVAGWDAWSGDMALARAAGDPERSSSDDCSI